MARDTLETALKEYLEHNERLAWEGLADEEWLSGKEVGYEEAKIDFMFDNFYQ